MITSRIRRQLEIIDWDFSEHLPGSSKTIHWYPGTFPSELPGTLIQALSNPEDLIFDPYGGVGTTALEALRQGRRAWVVEGNPVGCLVSYISGCMLLLKGVEKSLPSIIIESLRSVIASSNINGKSIKRIVTDDHIAKEADLILKKLVTPAPIQFRTAFKSEPNWESLGKWIEEETLQDIRQILDAINISPLKNFGKMAGLVMISANLRPASSQTQSWGHIADNVWPKKFERKDIYKMCAQWLSRTENIINKTEVSNLPTMDKRFWVSFHSWQKGKIPKVQPNSVVDVLLTSPPYAGAIDYTLAQRLTLYLLGYSEEQVKCFCNMEIGARRKRFLPASQANWVTDMVHALSQQISFLSADASLAFVLPHKDAGRQAGSDGIEEYLANIKCCKLMEVDRSIRQGRTRQSWTSIKKEIIQIYSF